ncbi:MAG: membrane protein insertase YidC [Pleomorphochaeta sp.]
MDKRTVLAMFLTIVVVTLGMFIQTTFFTPEIVPTEEIVAQEEITTSENNESVLSNNTSSSKETSLTTTSTNYNYVNENDAWNSGKPGSFVALDENTEKEFIYNNGVLNITFDTKGASVSSIKLVDHLDTEGNPVELLFKGDSDKNAFLMYAGDNRTNPIDSNFNYSIQGNDIVFSQSFALLDDNSEAGDTFSIIKTYTFNENEYLFEVNITIENSVNKAIPLNFENNAYTLAFEPQLGPSFETMSNNNYSYRKFYTKYDGDSKKKTISVDGEKVIEDYVTWTALAGKYFAVIAIPDATKYDITLTQEENVDGLAQTNGMYYTRPVIKSAYNTDTFRFYCGPELSDTLSIYNNSNDNAFGLSGLNLDEAVDASSWLGWLENILKWALSMLNKIIPNYGIDIILLTIILKILINPLTKKSMQSSAKMSSLSPQMEELKKKYENNPEKLNKEMSELYRKEGVNPISGCLPMLIQFPILIAFYGLLNKHFELRGAMFIPGWITDLSQPETIFTLKFAIPFLGNQIHLLPILYTVSMIFSMKITQSGQSAAAGQSASMMKMMTYGMPIMFFFVLYNAPSGLLLYWSVMNAISILQQLYNNNKVKKNKTNVAFSKNKKGKKK